MQACSHNFVSIASFGILGSLTTVRYLTEDADCPGRACRDLDQIKKKDSTNKCAPRTGVGYPVGSDTCICLRNRRGVAARSLIQEKLYGGEDFYLQLDAHSR